PPVKAAIEDRYGNIRTGDSASITVAINSGPAGTLSGTLTQPTSSGVATFNDLSINLGGTYTLKADRTSPPTPVLATGTSNSFVIGKTDQTITFNTPTAVTYGVTPFTLSATASSGLPVTFQVISGPGTISGPGLNVLTVTGAGNIVIEADQ